MKENDFSLSEEGESASKLSEEGVTTGKDETLSLEIGSEIMLSSRSKPGESDRRVEARNLEKESSNRHDSLA